MEPQNQIIRAVLDLSPEISAAYSQAATLAGTAREKARDAVYRAYQCGQLLNRQKDGLDHGQWEQWLATNCPEIAPCTARRYMKLAKKANESLLGSATSVRQAYIGAGVIPEGKRKPADTDATTPPILFTHGLDQFRTWYNRRVASEPVDRWPPDSRHLLRNELAWFKRLYDDLGGDEPESPCGAVH
jgi:hypothetical protein